MSARGDSGAVAQLLDLEQQALVLYEALAGDDAALRAFAAHEREHVQALARALEALGGRRPAQPGLPTALPGASRARLKLLLERERALVAGYHDAIGDLQSSELVQLCARIMAAQAQHQVALRRRLGEEPVPFAFEQGQQ